MRTGYVYHEIFGWHDTGTFTGDAPSDPAVGLQPYVNYENADTKRRIHELIVVSGLIKELDRIEPREATDAELLRIHTKEHIESIKVQSLQRLGGDGGDGTTPFAKGGNEIARMAAGGAIELMDAVLSGRVKNGYALIRPPGHHAERKTGIGYCIFANLAIAIAHAKVVHKVKRVVTVDWDVHHGNGTQNIFANDPNVLTISIHQDKLYPYESGTIEERGVGDGFGSNINVPLQPGTGNGGYKEAFEKVVIPAIRKFKPDVIGVASGFDSCVFDPLGRMLVTAQGYADMTRMLMNVAEEVCDGRIIMTHEGGYNAVYSPFCGLFVMQELSGVKKLADPFGKRINQYPGQELTAAQIELISHSAALVDELP